MHPSICNFQLFFVSSVRIRNHIRGGFLCKNALRELNRRLLGVMIFDGNKPCNKPIGKRFTPEIFTSRIHEECECLLRKLFAGEFQSQRLMNRGGLEMLCVARKWRAMAIGVRYVARSSVLYCENRPHQTQKKKKKTQ
jgi:hypothetical protein